MTTIKRNDLVETIQKIARNVRPENFCSVVFALCEVWVNKLREQDGYDNDIKWYIDHNKREISFAIYDGHGEEVKRVDTFKF